MNIYLRLLITVCIFILGLSHFVCSRESIDWAGYPIVHGVITGVFMALAFTYK